MRLGMRASTTPIGDSIRVSKSSPLRTSWRARESTCLRKVRSVRLSSVPRASSPPLPPRKPRCWMAWPIRQWSQKGVRRLV